MRVECWPAHLAGDRPVTGPGNGRLLCKRSDSRAAEVFSFVGGHGVLTAVGWMHLPSESWNGAESAFFCQYIFYKDGQIANRS